jgi:predicted lipoprotein with Yx(FWY)xxD motif
MQPVARPHHPHRALLLGVLALVALLLVPVAAGTAARQKQTKRVVKLEEAAGGGLVLANLRGRTLYSLSAEGNGRFICTGGCLSVWPPLLVPKGVRPVGPVRLGTVKRPDGKRQVTYRGRPLYTFVEDGARGETNGEGIEDVGVWHAARKPVAQTPQPAPPAPYPGTPYPAPAPPVQSPPTPPPEDPYPYPY